MGSVKQNFGPIPRDVIELKKNGVSTNVEKNLIDSCTFWGDCLLESYRHEKGQYHRKEHRQGYNHHALSAGRGDKIRSIRRQLCFRNAGWRVNRKLIKIKIPVFYPGVISIVQKSHANRVNPGKKFDLK